MSDPQFTPTPENLGRIVDEMMTVLATLGAVDIAGVPDDFAELFNRTNLIETAARSLVVVDALDRLARRELLAAQLADGIA